MPKISQPILKLWYDELMLLLAQFRIHVDVELQLHSPSDLGGCFGVRFISRV